MEVDGESPTYALRSELRGHEEDVRALTLIGDDIVTGSRDKTIKIWKEVAPNAFNNDKTLVGHEHYVTALHSAAHAAPDVPRGALLSGSQDKSVMVWNVDAAVPTHVLKGHEYQVTSVAVAADGTIWSASQDGTVRLWRDGKCVEVLKEHGKAVQAVLALHGGDVLTAAADATIKRWSQSTCVHTYTGHTDTVRGLALYEGIGFASASHDLSVRVWSLDDGSCVAQLHGHTAIVYCVAISPSGLIASGAEDNTARVWRIDGSCIATIPHPGCVWSVLWLPNDDLVTACSDHVARIFTSSPDRQAEESVQREYAAVLQSRSAAADSNRGGGVPDGIKLDDPSMLLRPGVHDGETKIVSEAGVGMAYCWSVAKGEWEKIGEVVEKPGELTTARKLYRGQEWDYVWDVDIEDGAPHLKLAMNAGDNPYDVADRFLLEHDLPYTYREQVVQWILQQTAAQGVANVGDLPITGGGVDPFTGGGSSSESRHAPSRGFQASMPFSAVGGGVDPFTGGGSSGPRMTDLRHVPAYGMLLYDALFNVRSVTQKLQEFNNSVLPQDALRSQYLDDGGPLSGLLQRATNAARSNSDPSSSSSTLSDRSQFSQGLLDIVQVLLRWPAAFLFPVFDVLRLVVLDETAATWLASCAGEPVDDESQQGLGGALARAFVNDATCDASVLTALRLMCNCFRHSVLCNWLQQHALTFIGMASKYCMSPNKSIRQAVATLMLNLSVLARTGGSIGDDIKHAVISGIIEVLASTPAEDPETAFRALVAAGTLMLGNAALKRYAVQNGLSEMVQMAMLRTDGPSKVPEAAQDVDTVTKTTL